ncbi:hypothetical protein [Vibrio atypicus]|uniref:hypothetical protein n=1 Tax=Vibrio atypicus TaxID=558271 RepID=UPI0013581F35|nr:hypothetical protein [Vibrio atypicus]
MNSIQPFFSLFDPRMRPKGSRDPLGSESVWGHLGRRLVGNLTTVTSNLNNFFVSLLSSVYAHQNSDRELAQIQERFARMEQLLAYVRYSIPTLESNSGILGITKVKQRLENETVTGSRIVLGLAAPLLNNQLSMGLWGLYTPAMARAELVEIDNRKLTKTGEKLATYFILQLGSTWDALCKVCDDGELLVSQLKAHAEHFECLIGAPENRARLVEDLIAVNQNCRAQSALYTIANEYLANEMEIGTQPFLNYLSQCGDASLESYARDITQVEPVLVINDAIFTWLQGQHDQPVKEVIDKINQRMNHNTYLIPDSLTSLPNRSFLTSSATLLNAGDSEHYLQSLLQHHLEIMKRRNGAPWVEVRDEKIFVRVVSDTGTLPDIESGFASLSDTFENSYFLYSFLLIAQEAIRKEEKQ